MFKDAITGEQSFPGEKPVKVVTKSRVKQYENIVKQGRHEKTIESTGWEIVKEALVKKETYDKIKGEIELRKVPNNG